MSNWLEQCAKIEVTQKDSIYVVNEKLNLRKIFWTAEQRGLSADLVQNASLSTLRAITPSALKAIDDEDYEELGVLLGLAGSNTFTQLRHTLDPYNREDITLNILTNAVAPDGGPVFSLHVTYDQIIDIARSCERKFAFILHGHEFLLDGFQPSEEYFSYFL